MKIPSVSQESERLQDLFRYQILDTLPEEEFDELVDLSALVCNCPIAVISFIDDKRQYFKAKIGLSQTECPRDLSICQYTIQQDDVFVVGNTLLDERFAGNPAVAGPVHLRFYAGAPIYSGKGHRIGTICVIDKRPKTLLPKQLEALEKLSRQVSRLLELRLKNFALEHILRENVSFNDLKHTTEG